MISQKTKFRKGKGQIENDIEIEKIKDNCEELISKHRYNQCNKYNQEEKF